jgi:hypothetical protein
MGRLPFKPLAPGAELARTMQVPVPNWQKGETTPLGDDSITKAVAALPFVGNTVGAALAPFPLLPLEAYASLRAELSLWPERAAEILPRYHVLNQAAHTALEEHWQRELAARPEARAAFGKLLAEYTAWLRTRRVSRAEGAFPVALGERRLLRLSGGQSGAGAGRGVVLVGHALGALRVVDRVLRLRERAPRPPRRG